MKDESLPCNNPWSPSVSGMQRIKAGQAHCALCREVIRPDEDAFITPDFLASESDPWWRFADAPMHRACFLVWDRRKAFVARYNRAARHWVAPDGSHPRMTSEGEIVRKLQSKAILMHRKAWRVLNSMTVGLLFGCGGGDARSAGSDPPGAAGRSPMTPGGIAEAMPVGVGPSCDVLATALRRQFGIARLTTDCLERTVWVEAVDSALAAELAGAPDSLAAAEAAAHVLARSIWARTRQSTEPPISIMVTLSGVPLQDDAGGVMYTIGRAALSGWLPEPADTTRPCLTPACR